MDQKAYDKIKDRISHIHRHKLGIAVNKKLHPIIRDAVTTWEFKRLQKGENTIDSAYEHFGVHVKEHYLKNAETDEEQFMAAVELELARLFIVLYNIALFEKHDLMDLKRLEKELAKRGLQKEAKKIIMEAVHEWKGELEALRKNINGIYSERTGSRLSANNTIFQAMHKDGTFMTRRKERALWKDAIHNDKNLEKHLSALGKVKNRAELEKIMEGIGSDETHMTHDYEVLHKFLFASWAHVDKQLNGFINAVCKAAEIHEIPRRDSAQFIELKSIVLDHMVGGMLKDLRLIVNQLEGEIDDVAKAA